MAWTSGKIQLLCDMWSANCSLGFIGTALDMSRNAVAGKVFRLRKTEDAHFMMAELLRSLARSSGAMEVTTATARHALRDGVFKGWLEGKAAQAGVALHSGR